MANPGYSPADLAEAAALVEKHGSVGAAARATGIPYTTLERRFKTSSRTGVKVLTGAGYNLNVQERTPQQAWDTGAGAFEYKVASSIAKQGKSITRKGPFCIFHCTDPHVDDDAAALKLIEADVQAAHDLGAIMCHGGDLLNNWPMAGKLAKQWAEQSCTLPDALLRAKHYIDIFRPDVWVDGNHEEMNPYLIQMLEGWLPKKVIKDYWRVDFTVKVPGANDTKVALSHKFQKGGSWFNPAHGGIREMLEGEDFDLFMEGHIHIDGVMERTLPERGHSALIVASAGYKVVDKYAARISRGGKIPKIKGRAHWIICDPFIDGDGTKLVAFKCPRQAEAYLGGLQNLRAA